MHVTIKIDLSGKPEPACICRTGVTVEASPELEDALLRDHINDRIMHSTLMVTR